MYSMLSILRKRDFGGLFELSATILEEVAEQTGGFGFENAAFDEDSVIEASVGGDIVEGASVSGFGIRGRVDQTRETGCVGCACAHWARLQGGIEGTAGQAPAACSFGCPTDGEELSVRGWVACSLALVGGDGQDLLSPGDDGPYRNLALTSGVFRGKQGAAHHG